MDDTDLETFDVAVIGGGPAGATAAHDLAQRGHSVLLLDRAGRTKPCGGAIPPRLIKDFEIPDSLLVARARAARMVSPRGREVDIPIEGGFVGMVDRDVFDEWLRTRAAGAGATRRRGSFEGLSYDSAPGCIVSFKVPAGAADATRAAGAADVVGAAGVVGTAGAAGVVGAAEVRSAESIGETTRRVRARIVIGADGARSRVAQAAGIPGLARSHFVFAYHEIVRTPEGHDPGRCDVHYRGELSPDFYGWVFPHGDTMSIGTGSADKGFSLRGGVAKLRESTGLAGAETLRREGAPIPLKPLPRWDNGRDVVLAGDAAGVVAPASGEGIYYAMTGGRLAADAAMATLRSGKARDLMQARKRFMREHGRVFWVLGIMQRFWYCSEKRRERFVSICDDRDVQQLTFDAYMNKRLVRARPMAHVRIFFKDMAHLLGLARV